MSALAAELEITLYTGWSFVCRDTTQMKDEINRRTHGTAGCRFLGVGSINSPAGHGATLSDPTLPWACIAEPKTFPLHATVQVPGTFW